MQVLVQLQANERCPDQSQDGSVCHWSLQQPRGELSVRALLDNLSLSIHCVQFVVPCINRFAGSFCVCQVNQDWAAFIRYAKECSAFQVCSDSDYRSLAKTIIKQPNTDVTTLLTAVSESTYSQTIVDPRKRKIPSGRSDRSSQVRPDHRQAPKGDVGLSSLRKGSDSCPKVKRPPSRSGLLKRHEPCNSARTDSPNIRNAAQNCTASSASLSHSKSTTPDGDKVGVLPPLASLRPKSAGMLPPPASPLSKPADILPPPASPRSKSSLEEVGVSPPPLASPMEHEAAIHWPDSQPGEKPTLPDFATIDINARFSPPPPSVLPQYSSTWRPHGGERVRIAHAHSKLTARK